ncbi:reticulon-like protein B21 [Gossypium raimondii]|uniref:reticulon-like protein B21 n=1 Tax=Gossypium raimondii TaxID=29730 RepID=UPI00227C62D4|nr:reticulon-like protein B21 [Gossypium raimondii]
MDLSFRRGEAKGSVVAGSVWETRMKSDEVKGGIKVFNAGSITEENSNGVGGTKRLSLKKGQPVVGGVGMRKTWKNESFEGLEKNPIQIAKGKAEEQCKELSVSVGGISKRNHQIRVAKGRSLEHCKDLSLSVDGIKSPVQVKKGRSEGMRELSKSVDGIERSPIHMKKPRSEVPKRSKDVNEGGERMEGNSVQLMKSKSDQSAGNGNGNEGNQKVLVLDDQNKGNNVPIDEDEEKNGSESEEKCKEFGVCQETSISSNGDIVDDGDGVGVGDDEEISEEEEEEEEIEEVENEKKSFDIKEMTIPEKKLADERKKLPEEKPGKAEVNKLQEDKPNKVVNEVKKISQFHNKTSPFSSTLNKQVPPVVKRAASVYTTPTKPTISDDYHYQSFPQSQNKLQNLVDLVMWRDVSKSALVFGMGTFIIISSSYTQDLNISFISATSYVCLVYLAAIFLYRSIICRGVVDVDELSYVVGEEEAFWLLKLVLPYLNEFLIKLRALFSGDPATTMKLAVLLFVLARCGSSITIWKMTKLGFFGVFIVPKVCSAYSHQLTAYGKFWIRRFRDAWESCTHKNAVAMAIFTLVWNLCSFVGRVWAAFMLFVALRYYQQKMVTNDWVEDEDGPSCQQTWEGPIGKQTHGLAP